MSHEHRGALVQLGLSAAEAQVYLALLRNASQSASTLARTTGLSRSRVYQTLSSLGDKGLVESGAGYGSKFAIPAPEEALPALIDRERETLAERKNLAERTGQQLATLVEPVESAPQELVQILRHPKVVADRYERLQLEAEEQINQFVKGPFYLHDDNPAEAKALRRGVRIRVIYERAALEDPEIKPYLEHWLALGEEARIYDDELPHKLAIFDCQKILMPLITPDGLGTTLFIRHPQLAKSLGMFFESLWEKSEPLSRSDGNGKRPARSLRTSKQRRPPLTPANRAGNGRTARRG